MEAELKNGDENRTYITENKQKNSNTKTVVSLTVPSVSTHANLRPHSPRPGQQRANLDLLLALQAA